MPQPVTRRTAALLRCSFWLAAAGYAVNILEPGLIDQPSLQLGGSHDDPSAVIHWAPTALLVWMVVSSQLRKMGHRARFGRAKWSSSYARRPDEVGHLRFEITG
jgi:hypothetical protein